MNTFEGYLERQHQMAIEKEQAAYRKHRRNCKTREERKLTRQINTYVALFALFLVVMAIMALRATFGW